MAIQAREAFEYAARQMHEDPDSERLEDLRLLWLNSAKDRIAEWGKWRFLEAWGTLTSNSSGVFYFPSHVWEVASMYPSSLGYRRPVDFVGGPSFDRAGPSIASGLADYASAWGYYGVKADAPATATLSFDIAPNPIEAGIRVVVEGLDTNREPQFETVTLDANGAGATTLSFLGGVDGVRRHYVIPDSLFTDGGVTRLNAAGGVLTTTMSGTTMVTLDLTREVRKEFLRVELYPQNATTEFTYRYYKRIPDIISLDHVLEIPHEYKDLYVDLVKAHIAEFQDGIMAAAPYLGSAVARLNSLKRREERQPARQRGVRPSKRYRRLWRW